MSNAIEVRDIIVCPQCGHTEFTAKTQCSVSVRFYIDNNLIVESVESTKTAVDTDVISTIIKSATISFSIGLNLLNAKNQDPDPFRRPGQKKQGRERKTKARKNPDWVQRNGKRGGPKPLPKHTPGKAHRKYFSYVIDLLYLL